MIVTDLSLFVTFGCTVVFCLHKYSDRFLIQGFVERKRCHVTATSRATQLLTSLGEGLNVKESVRGRSIVVFLKVAGGSTEPVVPFLTRGKGIFLCST